MPYLLELIGGDEKQALLEGRLITAIHILEGLDAKAEYFERYTIVTGYE